MQRNDLVSAVDRGPGELIADIEAQPAAGPRQDPETLPPGVVQVLEVFVEALAEAESGRRRRSP